MGDEERRRPTGINSDSNFVKRQAAFRALQLENRGTDNLCRRICEISKFNGFAQKLINVPLSGLLALRRISSRT